MVLGLFEIFTTTSMAGIALSSYLMRHRDVTSDHDKIIKIANEAGLRTKSEGLRIYRKSKHKENGYTDYVYKLPLGLSLKQFEDKQYLFTDGLNNKSRREFRFATWSELRDVILDYLKSKNIADIPTLLTRLQDLYMPRVSVKKQLELSYDGMLKFRVYDKGLENMVTYDQDLLDKMSHWKIPIGMSLDGLITHDFEKMQMMVIAGMTRYGKTVMLKNIITTLIHNEPDRVEFTLIDLKGGLAFNRFARCKQVKTVAKNATETIKALEAIHERMLEQQLEFLIKGYEDIGEAGYQKRHFIIIDEGAEIAGFTDKTERERCMHLIGEIARIGAGLSYRMIFATQYPTADVFPRAVKSNTSASLSFKLKTATQSMVVLDKTGAEELPVGLCGRAIYQSDREVLVQTPYIQNSFIDDKIKPFIKNNDLDNIEDSNKPITVTDTDIPKRQSLDDIDKSIQATGEATFEEL